MFNYSNIVLEQVELSLSSFCYDPVPAGSNNYYSHGINAVGLKYLVRQEKLASPVDGDFIDFYVTIYPQVKEIECTCPSHRAEKTMCAHIAEVLFYYMFDALDRQANPEAGKMSRRMREELAPIPASPGSEQPLQPAEIIGIVEGIVAAAWQDRARATLKRADNLIARFDLF